MKLLLDTRAFPWWVGASRELSRRARSAVGSGRTADPVFARYGVERVW